MCAQKRAGCVEGTFDSTPTHISVDKCQYAGNMQIIWISDAGGYPTEMVVYRS